MKYFQSMLVSALLATEAVNVLQNQVLHIWWWSVSLQKLCGLSTDEDQPIQLFINKQQNRQNSSSDSHMWRKKNILLGIFFLILTNPANLCTTWYKNILNIYHFQFSELLLL